MILALTGEVYSPTSTLGDLAIYSKFGCHTLEANLRETKAFGKSCIPYGMYQVIISLSERFQEPRPLFLSVPCSEGIRIHAGNTAEDTEGSIFAGREQSKDFIEKSRLAFKQLMGTLLAALKKEKVWMEMRSGS